MNLTIFFRLFYGSLYLVSIYIVVTALINLQKSRLRIYGLLTLTFSILCLSILINIISTSNLAIIYSQKMFHGALIYIAGFWLMFIFELSNHSIVNHYRAISFYTLMISTFFTYLFFSSYDTELFFVSYEIQKYSGLKLIQYNKTDLYNIYTVYNIIVYFSTGIYCLLSYKKTSLATKKFLLYSGIISFVAVLGTIFDYFLYNIATVLFLPIYLIFGIIFNNLLNSYTYTGTKFSNIFSNLREAVIILDKKGRVVHCNAKAFIVFPELLDKNFPINYNFISSIPISEILSGRLKKIKHIIPSTSEKKLYNISVNELSKDLRFFDGISIIFYDNTEYKRLYDKYSTSAKFDYLTGIYNKAFFNRYGNKMFKQSLNQDLNFSLLIFDVDNFHKINTNHSFEIGDKLLKDLAHIYEKMMKEFSVNSSSLYRLSGDIFAVIFIDITTEQALSLSETLRETIENTPIVSSTNVINYTISGGLEMLQMSSAITFEKLIHNAKVKLTYAKETGKNKIIYSNISK